MKNKNLKIGDVVTSRIQNHIFSINQQYIVFSVIIDHDLINYDIDYEYIIENSSGVKYTFDDDELFDQYFYNKIEVRKIKLNRIENEKSKS